MKIEPFALITNSAARTDKVTGLRNALGYVQKSLNNASDAVIISAYYGEDFIRKIVNATKTKGKKRTLTFVFAGLPDIAREEQVDDLTQLKRDIIDTIRCPERNIDIRLAINTRFLHAKVFRFRSGNKPPVYLIGSANFSNAAFEQNDEAMVAIKGRHPGLNDYIKYVLAKSTPINALPTETAARTWRDFLRNAYLYFRPSRAVPFALDPFKEDEFRHIADRLRETVFNPLPFSERNVLGLNIATLLQLEVPENTKLGFRMPTYSIETDYGYWVPKAYVDFIDRRLDESSGPRLRALERRGKELQQAGDQYVNGQIKVYLDEVARRIKSGGRPLTLTNRHRDTISEKIKLRVKHLTKMLTHRKSLERLAQAWVGAPVPEFWEDQASVDRFFDGFCYDVITKMNLPRNVPAIVTHIAQRFRLRGDDDTDSCREKIESFFDKGGSWPLNNWPAVSEQEEQRAQESATTRTPFTDDEIPF